MKLKINLTLVEAEALRKMLNHCDCDFSQPASDDSNAKLLKFFSGDTQYSNALIRVYRKLGFILSEVKDGK